MKSYAYLDKGNILHLVAKQIDAKRYSSNGKYSSTEIESKGGYPLVQSGKKGNFTEIIVYSLDEAYINGNNKDGKLVSLENYADIKSLYSSLI